MENSGHDVGSCIHDKQAAVRVFEEFCPELDSSCRGYSFSECCEKINQSLYDSNKEIYISKRQFKNLFMEKF